MDKLCTFIKLSKPEGRVSGLICLILRYEMIHGILVIGRVILTLNEINKWSVIGRSSAVQLKGMRPEQQTEFKNVTFCMSGEVNMLLQAKTFQTRCKVLSESLVNIVHMNIKITQQYYKVTFTKSFIRSEFDLVGSVNNRNNGRNRSRNLTHSCF